MEQVVEWLPSKYQALRTNPSTARKRKKRQRRKEGLVRKETNLANV
jgi:hypothetical protein